MTLGVGEGQELLEFLVGLEDVSREVVEGLDRSGVLCRQQLSGLEGAAGLAHLGSCQCRMCSPGPPQVGIHVPLSSISRSWASSALGPVPCQNWHTGPELVFPVIVKGRSPVLADQALDGLSPLDAGGHIDRTAGLVERRSLFPRLVRPVMVVVVLGILSQDLPEAPFAVDQQVVEALAT